MYTSIKDTVSLLHLILTTTAFHFIMLFAVKSMPIFYLRMCTKSGWKVTECLMGRIVQQLWLGFSHLQQAVSCGLKLWILSNEI